MDCQSECCDGASRTRRSCNYCTRGDVARRTREGKGPSPKAKAAPAVPALGARAQRIALCAHLSNDNMHRLRKAVIRNGYASHTDRWRNQPGCADTCRAKVPPDPEWLVYADGTTAREDGQRGDAFPAGR